MSEIPIVNDITALGLVALVLMLGYYFLQKVFRILTDHLERMVRRQDQTILLLQKCIDSNLAIKESLQNIEPD